jgi:uncharacterized membrane protein YeaQ/YmgE (transglycosylase-associated protein family)
MVTWIKKHFRGHLERRPWGFCWRIGIESTAVSLSAAALLALLFEVPEREFLNFSIGEAFLLLIVVAPPLETLLLQALPIFIVRLLKGSMRIQVYVSTAVFASLHFPEGLVTGIAAGIIGGLYFGFAYAHWRTKSRWKSFWITTVGHSIHNAIAFLLLAVFGAWG